MPEGASSPPTLPRACHEPPRAGREGLVRPGRPLRRGPESAFTGGADHGISASAPPPAPPVASPRGRGHRPGDRHWNQRRDRPPAKGSRRRRIHDGRRDKSSSWRTPFTPWRGDILDAAPFRIGGGSPVKSLAVAVTSLSPVRGSWRGKALSGCEDRAAVTGLARFWTHSAPDSFTHLNTSSGEGTCSRTALEPHTRRWRRFSTHGSPAPGRTIRPVTATGSRL